MSMPKLRVSALICGQPGAVELWTLRRMHATPCELTVIQSEHATAIPAWKRFRRMRREMGLPALVSRFLAKPLAARIAKQNEQLLDQLLDVQELRQWWSQSGLTPMKVPTLNHEDCRVALREAAPDVIVRVSGGILKPHIFSLARLAALNIHHGRAPLIRGMWSIPWGLVEGRRDWIGATVHVIDAGIDTGTILWRGITQLAPGDTQADLFFRSHLEAVDALAAILTEYASGTDPRPWPIAPGEVSTYRSAPGLGTWLKFLYWGAGRRAPVSLERNIEC